MAYTWLQFRQAVRALLTERTPTDTAFVEAATAYVRAQVALSIVGDDKLYAIAENKYRSLRRRLAGFQTSMSDSVLKSEVRKALSDLTAGDAMFSQAVAYYVQAELARDPQASEPLRKNYLQLRLRLAGFQTSLSDSVLAADVRSLISDTTRTNTMFTQAVAYYVKAEILREVNRDDEMAQSFLKSYAQLRFRLAGFVHTLGAGLRAEVDKHLPVDKDRNNISGDYINKLVAAAVDDIQGFGPMIDATIARAKADLQGFATWIDTHILQAKDDLQALDGRVDKEIRQGVIDLQHFIEAYRKGHTSDFDSTDAEEIGNASLVTVPDQAQVNSVWIVYNTFDDPVIHRDKATVVAWDQRQERMIGNLTALAQAAISPSGSQLICTPKLSLPDGIALTIEWDGLKIEFADGDTTPFDEGAVKAVACFVQAELAAEFGDSALSIKGFRSDYATHRTHLYVEARGRGSIRDSDNLNVEPGYPLRKGSSLP